MTGTTNTNWFCYCKKQTTSNCLQLGLRN